MTTSTDINYGKELGLVSCTSFATAIGLVLLKMYTNENYMIPCIILLLVATFVAFYRKSLFGWGNTVYMSFAILAIQSVENPYFQWNAGLASIIFVMLISNIAIAYIRNIDGIKSVKILECTAGFTLGVSIVFLSNGLTGSIPVATENIPSITRNVGW